MLKRIAAATMVALGMMASSAQAAYPDHTIRLIVPFVTGGSASSAARVIAQGMSEVLGQTVYVDNIGGAGGNIGTAVAAKAAPDGYTILIASAGIMTVNPALYKQLPFAPQQLAPIGLATSYPLVIFVNRQLPAQDFKGLIAYAKANPGKVTFGSAGYGSSGHLFGELLKEAAQVDMVHVPYKGGGQAMADVLGGQISLMMEASVVGMPHVKDGGLRPFAVTSTTRLANLPNVPTVSESGFPGFDAVGWYALLAPAGTPPDIVVKLNSALNQTLSKPEIRDRLREMGMEPVPGTPEVLQSLIRSDTAKWSKVVKKSGIVLD